MTLNLFPVMLKRLTLTGSTLRARPTADKAAIAARLKEQVWPRLEEGSIRPLVHRTFPLGRGRRQPCPYGEQRPYRKNRPHRAERRSIESRTLAIAIPPRGSEFIRPASVLSPGQHAARSRRMPQ